MTTTVNKTVSLGESIFKSLVFDPAIKAGMAALIADFPWMAVWPISAILNAMVNGFEGYMFNVFTTAVDVSAIKLLNQQAHDQYVKSSINLMNTANQYGVNSSEYKTALAQEVAAQITFTRYNS